MNIEIKHYDAVYVIMEGESVVTDNRLRPRLFDTADDARKASKEIAHAKRLKSGNRKLPKLTVARLADLPQDTRERIAWHLSR